MMHVNFEGCKLFENITKETVIPFYGPADLSSTYSEVMGKKNIFIQFRMDGEPPTMIVSSRLFLNYNTDTADIFTKRKPISCHPHPKHERYIYVKAANVFKSNKVHNEIAENNFKTTTIKYKI